MALANRGATIRKKGSLHIGGPFLAGLTRINPGPCTTSDLTSSETLVVQKAVNHRVNCVNPVAKKTFPCLRSGASFKIADTPASRTSAFLASKNVCRGHLVKQTALEFANHQPVVSNGKFLVGSMVRPNSAGIRQTAVDVLADKPNRSVTQNKLCSTNVAAAERDTGIDEG
jgi:hypothetical protein